jgi:hypothetical protein
MAANDNGSQGEEWSASDARLALAIASGYSIRQAARIAHVSQRTATRRCADEAFKAEVNRLRRDLLTRSTGRLVSASTRAVKTLVRLLDCGSPAVELGAAGRIIEHANKGVEVDEITRRLERIEQALAEAKTRPGVGL